MVGVLHLHSSRCDFQTDRCLELLFKNTGSDQPFTSRTIGPGGDYQNLAEAIYRLRCTRPNQTHIAHAWGPGELLAAAAAGFSNLVFSPQAQIHPKWWKWLAPIFRRREVMVVCPTEFVKRTFILHGARADCCHVISPAVDAGRLNGADPEICARLGIDADDIVLLAPGESTREASHRSALWATAILNFIDRRYRLLVWGHGPMVESLCHFAKVTEGNRLLIVARQRLGSKIEFDEIVPAADAALLCARPGSPILPMAICLAAGLPVVATETTEVAEFLTDNVNALLERSTNPRRLAQRVLDLQNNSSLRQMLAPAARKRGDTQFSVARYTANWRHIYARINGYDSADKGLAISAG
jgi:glycosyltransferase involved in cell wall biosynthesis